MAHRKGAWRHGELAQPGTAGADGGTEHRAGGPEPEGGRPAAEGIWPQPPGLPAGGGPAAPDPGAAKGPHDPGAAGRGGPVPVGQRRRGLAGRGHHPADRGDQRGHLHLSGGQGPQGPGGAGPHGGPPRQSAAGRQTIRPSGGGTGARGRDPAGGRGSGARGRAAFGVQPPAGGRERHDRRVGARGEAGGGRPAGGHPPGRPEQHGAVRHPDHRRPGPGPGVRHGDGHPDGPHRRPAHPGGGPRHPPSAEDGGDLQVPVLSVPVRVRGDVRGGPAAGTGYAVHVPHRRVSGGGRHPGGTARHRHHRAGPGGGPHGKAGGHREKAPGCRDTGLRRGDLLR